MNDNLYIADAIALYNNNGGHFFDADTMKFFNSRIHDNLYNNYWFITSEKDDFTSAPRRYTIRVFSGTYDRIASINFNKYPTLNDAKKDLKAFLKLYDVMMAREKEILNNIIDIDLYFTDEKRTIYKFTGKINNEYKFFLYDIDNKKIVG